MVNEARILKLLGNRVGFPKLFWYGREGDFNLMVIELLGENLEDLMKTMSGKRFTTFTVLNIVDQLLRRVQQLHEKDYIHRDLKPENFCIGLGSSK